MSKKSYPNAGSNRKQRREIDKNPKPYRSSRPLWLRILILAVMGVMLIGFFILPLLR